jgi:hypothetical protein
MGLAPIRFPRRDQARVPERWLTFGSRSSLLSGHPQRSITAANSVLNYLNAVALAECSIGLLSLGMDAAAGYLHADLQNPASLSCDIFEEIRPDVEGWLLDWLAGKILSRDWFHELPGGECRLSLALCRELSGTAPLWRAKIGPVCERLAETLTGRKVTPLTSRRRREAQGGGPAPLDRGPVLPTFCRECGAGVQSRRAYCAVCARARMRQISAHGRAAARKPEVAARIREASRRQKAAAATWDPATLPGWLTLEAYEARIRPQLQKVSIVAIARECGLGRSYARLIRLGERIPHERHWEKLAALVGVKEN